jgi:hypothetical protein
MGLVASICWLQSFHGYYSWLKSWIKIVHYHEDQIAGNNSHLRVYSLVFEDAVKKRGYSTQKITRVFINLVILAWLILLTHEIYSHFSTLIILSLKKWIIIGIVAIYIIYFLTTILYIEKKDKKDKKSSCWLLSYTDNMYKLKVDVDETNQNKRKYTVEQPMSEITFEKTSA